MIDARTREQAVLVALVAAMMAGMYYGPPPVAGFLGLSLGLWWGSMIDRGTGE